MIALEPHEISFSTEAVLVDVRPLQERYGGMGFLPGSLSLPRTDPVERFAERLHAICGELVPTLVCLSGARARACAEWVGPSFGGTVTYLAGGVLGWGAEGLPLCWGPSSVSAVSVRVAAPLEELSRHMTACFVGELADVSIEHELDPLALLRSCFARAGQDYDRPNPELLHRVLDHAALSSVRLGTPLRRVAANVDRMLAMLPAPCPAVP